MGNQHGAQEDGQGGVIFANNYKNNFGYKLIELMPGSPAARAGLEPFLDYIVYSPSVTGERKLLFSEYLLEQVGKEVILKVYNLIQQGTRLVHIDLTALRVDQFASASAGDSPLLKEQKIVAKSVHENVLGAKLRYEQYDEAHYKVLAVADVYLGSPAQEADLQPFKDFILGTKELTFQSLEAFAKYVQVNQNRPVDMYVYNIDREGVRCATVVPRDNWSGEGLIGADVSFGFLNRLPMRKRDQANEKKAQSMKNVFGLFSGKAESANDSAEDGQREPTSEGLSSSDSDREKPTPSAQSFEADFGSGQQIKYEEAQDDAEESYYDEEDEGDAGSEVQRTEQLTSEELNGRNLDDVEYEEDGSQQTEAASRVQSEGQGASPVKSGTRGEEQEGADQGNGASSVVSTPEKPSVAGNEEPESTPVENSTEIGSGLTATKQPESRKSPEKKQVTPQISDKRLKSIANLAASMVTKASAVENTFNVPDLIEDFVPKRVGHVEHQNQYRLDF